MENEHQIRRHSLKSIKWIALGAVLPKLITPVITIFLAKILIPADFGIISICSIFIGFINLIQGLGFSDFIIKEQNKNEVDLNTAFWSSLGLSIFVSALMWGTAPFIADIYNEPIIGKALPILGLVVVFNGTGTVQCALLQKEMKFKSLFKSQLLPLFVSLCIVLPMAYLGYGVWALIMGEVSRSFLTNASYWLMGHWVPRLVFSIESLKKMMMFGSWIIFEKVQEYLFSSLDRIFLGYFANLSILGIYSIARQITNVIYNTINGPIGGIVFPMMSKLQFEPGKIKKGFFEVTKRVMFVNIPATFGAILFSFIVIPILFSNKWEGLPLVFCIGVIGEGLARLIWAQREMFKLLNRPDIYPKSIMINVVFSVILYPLGAMEGVIIFCIVRTLNDVLYVVVQLKLVTKFLGFKVMDFLMLSFTPLISSISTALIVFILILIMNNYGIQITVLPVILIFCFFAISYFLFFRLINRNDFEKLLSEIKIIIGFS